MKEVIPLSRPDVGEKEIEYVNEVLRSGVLSIGPVIERFEQLVSEYIGVKHAIAVNSGTSALHLMIRACGIEEGDEVITTPFSFIASTNCILFERGKPVFVDIDPRTFNLDINQIEARITSKTKGILPVDVFGQPFDIEAVNDIAHRHNLVVIQDSCEALGSAWRGKMAGSQSTVAAFAFYPNKQITTAEGGVIVTNVDEIAELCRSMRSQGRAVTGTWLEHQRLGYNYRLSEVHAAIGVAQMERLDEIIAARQKVAEMYAERLQGIPGVSAPWIAGNVTRMSWFVYVITLDEGINRNKVMYRLQEAGIGCKPYFTPIHHQPHIIEMTGYSPGDFPVTENIAARTIALPFFTRMSEEQVDTVTRTLATILKSLG
ncbi:MAG: DegT/DnrJ/EryC1/StrS family aminotransferase [Bacillota bacterium]|jgi:perosamine synthetase|nr:DegT/DnrJ/EryC1/StrS family aminotransferase [Bacillota bacterium]HOC06391.1 DegT/DnrJ/EryC1/StrS family aminotransferase [Bacillota bacterium]HPZ21862.1 DegT/DnrJ/EryC1/StrS family aminotransferase [Bacillota bacterium]